MSKSFAYSFTTLCLCSAILSGCASIMEMDQPLAPPDLMWTKGVNSAKEVDLALRECGRKIAADEKLMAGSGKERNDFNAICMLKKGFTFVPKPGNFADFCSRGMFYDSIACKSNRGEYKVAPE